MTDTGDHLQIVHAHLIQYEPPCGFTPVGRTTRMSLMAQSARRRAEFCFAIELEPLYVDVAIRDGRHSPERRPLSRGAAAFITVFEGLGIQYTSDQRTVSAPTRRLRQHYAPVRPQGGWVGDLAFTSHKNSGCENGSRSAVHRARHVAMRITRLVFRRAGSGTGAAASSASVEDAAT